MRRLIPLLTLAAAFLAGASRAGEAPPPRLLMISLDAVPYGVVARIADPALGEGAAFPGFAGPAPVISTFPSTTSLALAGMLGDYGLAKSPGYEHRFYDREQGRKRGGGLFSYRRLLFPWRKHFDWQAKGIFRKGLHLLHLLEAGRKAVEASLAAFAASDQPVFHLYHDITDLTGHVKGPDSLETFLRHLDQGLRELRRRPGGRPFHTVIYSDHGLAGRGEPLRNVRKGVKKAVRRSGGRVAGRTAKPDDVVFIPYGLVSSFVAFTAPGDEVAAAATLAGVDGVDLCVAPDGGGWRVVARRGSARVERRAAAGGDLYAYRILVGDPLGYGGLAEASPAGDGWHPDAWWFAATRDAPYPDALYRIVQAFALVENPASVICSVAEGHMYGSALTVLGSRISTGRLRWTHGALAREPSLGFVMSDAPGWAPPEVARFDEALRYWAPRPGHRVP